MSGTKLQAKVLAILAAVAASGCSGGGGAMTAMQIYDQAQPALVMIETAATQEKAEADPESANCKDKPLGRGSGFVIDKDGYILTNGHVVEPCPKSWPHPALTVRTADGATLSATLVGADLIGDLALIKVDHAFKTALTLADKGKIRPGEDVVALGFPGFLDGEATITRGIVSASSRSWGEYGGVVQTDAAVNHGNSGGPLINARGEVIGVNTFIYRPQEDFEAINFAISAKVAAREVADLRKDGEVHRADLGPFSYAMVDEMQAVENSTVESNPLSLGLLLTDVPTDSPLSSSLKACDMIDRIDGAPVRSVGDYYNAMLWAKSGTPVKIEFLRYPEGKCRMPDKCAFKSGLSAWGTGCPMDPLAPSSNSSSVLNGLTLSSSTTDSLSFSIQHYLDQKAKEDKQAQIDAEATKILEAHRDKGEPQSAMVTPN